MDEIKPETAMWSAAVQKYANTSALSNFIDPLFLQPPHFSIILRAT